MTQGHLIAAFLALLLWWLWPLKLPKRRPRDALDEPATAFGPIKASARELFTGTIFLGATGSAKTTTAAPILRDMLARSGAALFSIKLSEPEHLCKIATLAGRRDDIVLIGREYPENCINALGYAYESAGDSTEAVVMLIDSLAEIAGGGGKSARSGKDEFWRTSALNACRFAVNLLAPLGTSHVNFNEIGELIKSAPRSLEARPEDNAYWAVRSRLDESFNGLPGYRKKDVVKALRYFEGPGWAGLANETRSGILANISALSEMFASYPMRELLCAEETRVRPEDAWLRDKIFVFADSVQAFGQSAKITQCCWRYLFFLAVSRRNTTENDRWFTMYTDEAAELLLKGYEQTHLATCRQGLCANFYLVQALSQIHDALGDKHSANSLIGNLRNRLVLKGDEPMTVSEVSKWFGQGLRAVPGGGEGKAYDPTDIWGDNRPQSSVRFEYAPLVKPEDIAALVPGGPHGYAEAYVYKSGSVFPGGRNHELVRLPQLFV